MNYVMSGEYQINKQRLNRLGQRLNTQTRMDLSKGTVQTHMCGTGSVTPAQMI